MCGLDTGTERQCRCTPLDEHFDTPCRAVRAARSGLLDQRVSKGEPRSDFDPDRQPWHFPSYLTDGLIFELEESDPHESCPSCGQALSDNATRYEFHSKLLGITVPFPVVEMNF